MLRFIISAILCVAAIQGVSAGASEFRLSNTFGHHMVLQRDAVQPPAVIWGYAEPNTKVSTQFLEDDHETTTEDDGIWRLELPPTPAGGPYDLTFQLAEGENKNLNLLNTTLELRDIYFGGKFE